MSLAGKWHLRLDTPYLGEMERWWLKDLAGEYAIELPSTLDSAGIGYKPAPARGRPARKLEYEGCAWYQTNVDVPDSWTKKRITLFMERISRMSRVWVDRTLIGDCDSISTPHVYDLTTCLTPGRHRLTVMVDNTYAWIFGTGTFIGKWASCICDDLQTNWNGILGEIALFAQDAITVESTVITPDTLNKRVKADVCLLNNGGKTDDSIALRSVIKQNGVVLTRSETPLAAFSGEMKTSITLDMPPEAIMWDYDTPALCEVELSVLSANAVLSSASVTFGYRSFKREGTNFTLNGDKVFLRGSVEYTAFPKDGHVPMDEEEWTRIFDLSKQYGINHYRFHSYCPPEAAFCAADKLGVTFHVELPIWAEKAGYGEQIELIDFMKREGERILYCYANHPSFVMLCLGNEYKSNFDVLDGVIRHYRDFCADKLYTFTANYVSDTPSEESDFFVSDHTAAEKMRINCWTKDGRFQAYMDGTDADYSKSVALCPVPIVAHELGQWSAFPDYDYLDLYERDSIFDPENERILAKRLEAAGMMWQNKEFHYVTGRFSWLLYKEEIETCLRTPGYGGYVLLSLADSPGFGEAFTGAVNPWWQPKSFIDCGEIRRFCNSVVPLLRFSKYIYENDEMFTGKAIVANYGKNDLRGKRVSWNMSVNGVVKHSGAFEPAIIEKGGPSNIGEISVDLSKFDKPEQLTITLAVDGTEYENSWNIWVYPAKNQIDVGKLRIARSMAEAEPLLRAGEDVLLFADDREFDLQPTRFVSMFWSFWWFWRWEDPQPGNMSLLCDPNHPAFGGFPTDSHSNWQWWEILDQSRAFRLQNVPERYKPILQIVDDFHRNFRLAGIVEAKVEKGRLIACSHDLFTDLDKRPAARQLFTSLVDYAGSDSFNPVYGYDIDGIKEVLGFIR